MHLSQQVQLAFLSHFRPSGIIAPVAVYWLRWCSDAEPSLCVAPHQYVLNVPMRFSNCQANR